ncbi:response regulator receiver-modulated CheB methylesterase [Plasticicumulans lactativorans]|uniref:Protein-glutamate methylesterase/protein-glutamine glutaminase n=1 Tax=Plasticicumulans lactativorans TaxID=1133106 RepID=A0A4R2LEY8_9GAMM|nr:chemotaxis response regulator protein-glutamate methylesterase [Plasticicumulans lactativorans]TCO83307.1 response regulator receiver-modulated CheB methylesterase [Plasticicumulans lactativorans]
MEPSPIRVLIVDDAIVVRRMLARLLTEETDMEVVGTAANGRDALAKLAGLAPDLVILDIEMPEMDGLETLQALRRERPRLPVIMFSTLTRRGASATLEALARGASDYVTKPEVAGSVGEALLGVRQALLPKIRALCARAAPPPPLAPSAPPPASARPAAAVVTAAPPAVPRRPLASATAALRGQAPAVLAIGCSTGGPNALAALFAELPAGLGVPVLVVQHMPPVFTRMLAERLDGLGALQVREGVEGAVLRPGEAWIAPGDHHMTVRRSAADIVLALNRAPPENSCRPSVDVLLRSLAEVYGGRVLAVILTGMGQDGLLGATRLVEAGAQVLAQDERTSVVWGMPGAVARAGLAERVLTLSELATEIVARCAGGPLRRRPPSAPRHAAEPGPC